MAIRPVFVPKLEGNCLVEIKDIEFEWYPGFSASQKKKSMAALHAAYSFENPEAKILEVSSKSDLELGISLSAFNLTIKTNSDRKVTVESMFQSSKVFTKGGPFKDILYKTSREAKKDERIKKSGQLIRFEHQGEHWDLEPKTAFYDWIYLNALNLNDNLKEEALGYNAFTDIEFNPKKSINCQAYSLALYVSLEKRKLLSKGSIPPKDDFLKMVGSFKIENTSDKPLI